MSLVSIVIPAYNNSRYLQEAIDSVLNQDYPHIELIVLDDGSTDNTRNVLKEYGDRFYYETQQNMGQARTLNKGWQISKGDFLGYLSADDILLPSAVRRSLEVLSKEKDVVLTYCDYYLVDENSRIIRRVLTPEFSYEDMILNTVCPAGPGAFFRRTGFQKTGLWNAELRQVPDYDYWIRLSLHGTFLRIEEPLAKFRVHPQSQSHSEPDEERSQEIVDVISGYFMLEGIPKTVLKNKKKALSSASIVAARFHLMAGRYLSAFSFLLTAIQLNPFCFANQHALKYIGNGLSYRLEKLISRNNVYRY